LTDRKIKIVVIAGATSTGKSRTALELARRFSGEIINADSVQIYSRLDIGANKPDDAAFAAARHQLYSIIPPDGEMNAGIYARLATRTIEEVVSRGKLPIITGGTGLYIRALLYGFDEIPEIPSEIRSKLKRRWDNGEARGLYEYLNGIDHATAARLKPEDKQRILRAIEVHEATGKPLSRFLGKAARENPVYDALRLCLTLPRKTVYERIEKRVDEMIESGLIDEVRGILESGYSEELKSLKSLGYREVVRFLKGEITRGQMVLEIKKTHRNYAKRQFTWFKGERGMIFLPAEDYGMIEKTVENFIENSNI